MRISIDKFGGIVPKILEPALIPENRAQIAQNCRFDKGGVSPLQIDTVVQVSPKAAALSLYVYYDGGVLYFLTWNTDVDAVKAPLLADSWNRVFYAEAGVFKVTDKNLFKQGGTNYPMAWRYPSPLAPAAAPVATRVPVGGSNLETRGYAYTLVNGYGAEGPPSPVSNLVDVVDGDEVSVTGLDVSAAADYWILNKRIYRINQGTTGAQYQLVAEIPIAQASYSDTVLDANLGEVLASTEWDGPPAGIKGLIALPDGSLAGFFDNILCRSVPYYPHAWPAAYQKAFDRNIVGLGAYGTNIVVTTEGQPYIVVGTDPSNVVPERVEPGFASMAKRGTVDAGEIVLYPTPEGLAVIGPAVRDLLTKDVISDEQWTADYSPATISAFYWGGKYVGFYGGTKGFIFDPVTKDLVDLDFYATAGCYDKSTGTLYLVIGGNIVSFGAGATNRTLTYRSKRYRFAWAAFGCVKVIAETYPVRIDVAYPGIPATDVINVADDEPARLSDKGMVDKVEVRIHGTVQVSAVILASTIGEIQI